MVGEAGRRILKDKRPKELNKKQREYDQAVHQASFYQHWAYGQFNKSPKAPQDLPPSATACNVQALKEPLLVGICMR